MRLHGTTKVGLWLARGIAAFLAIHFAFGVAPTLAEDFSLITALNVARTLAWAIFVAASFWSPKRAVSGIIVYTCMVTYLTPVELLGPEPTVSRGISLLPVLLWAALYRAMTQDEKAAPEETSAS